jgi:hypothetical protein
MKIPKELYAGDSAKWDDDPTVDRLGNSIDSVAWTLKYVIAGATALTLTAAPKGSGWETSIAKADTTSLGAGDYFWQAYAESGADRITIGTGRITIKAAAGNNITGKSQIQQDLEAVQAAIRSIISGGAVAEYTIAGRSLRKIPMADLIMLESRLQAKLAAEKKAERIANGLGDPSNIYVRFRK